jgi:hypothetical protein
VLRSVSSVFGICHGSCVHVSVIYVYVSCVNILYVACVGVAYGVYVYLCTYPMVTLQELSTRE